MKYLLPFLFLMLNLSTVFSQNSKEIMKRDLYGNPFNTGNQNFIRMMNVNNDVLSEKNYFVYDDWKSMEIKGDEGQLLVIDSANYFIPESMILFMQDGEMMNVFANKTRELTIDGEIYVPLVDRSQNNPKSTFYQLLVDGNILLLKLWTSEEKVVTNNPMGIADASKVEIVKKSNLYYMEEGEILKVPKKKKDIIEIFKRKKNSVVKFASQNELSHKKEKDLILLFEYFNSL